MRGGVASTLAAKGEERLGAAADQNESARRAQAGQSDRHEPTDRGLRPLLAGSREGVEAVACELARAALDKIALGLLDGHVRHCLVGGHGGPSDSDEQAKELMGAVGCMISR